MTELTKPIKPSMPSMVRTFRKIGILASMPMTLGEKGVFSANVYIIWTEAGGADPLPPCRSKVFTLVAVRYAP
jgi:hypothetical protein